MKTMGMVVGSAVAAGVAGLAASPLVAGGAAGAWLYKAISSTKKK